MLQGRTTKSKRIRRFGLSCFALFSLLVPAVQAQFSGSIEGNVTEQVEVELLMRA